MAGVIPKTMPTPAETPNDKRTDQRVTVVGRNFPNKRLKPPPMKTPISPPPQERIMASVKN